MTINLFDHEELGDIQPLKDILASPIFDGLDLQGQIKYIINVNSRLKAMITDIKDELNARITQLEAERNKLAEAVGLMTTLKPTMVVDSAHPVEMALEVLEYIAQLTAERDEWRKDAERFIQLANYNNKRAGEYFELHQQLVEKYGTENPVSDADISG